MNKKPYNVYSAYVDNKRKKVLIKVLIKYLYTHTLSQLVEGLGWEDSILSSFLFY